MDARACAHCSKRCRKKALRRPAPSYHAKAVENNHLINKSAIYICKNCCLLVAQTSQSSRCCQKPRTKEVHSDDTRRFAAALYSTIPDLASSMDHVATVQNKPTTRQTKIAARSDGVAVADKSYAETNITSFVQLWKPIFSESYGDDAVFLDIGCGIGTLLVTAAQYFQVRQVIGIEQNTSHKQLFDTMCHELKEKSMLPSVPIQYVLGYIQDNLHLLKEATHCYCFCLTWDSDKIIDEVIKPIIDMLHSDVCTVRWIMWSMSPNIFFANHRSSVQGWAYNDHHGARMRISGNTSRMYVYHRPKPLYTKAKRGAASVTSQAKRQRLISSPS